MNHHNGQPDFKGACFRLSQIVERGERIGRSAVIDRLVEERRHDPETTIASKDLSRLDGLRASLGGRCYQCGEPTQPGLRICPVCCSPLWQGVDEERERR